MLEIRLLLSTYPIRKVKAIALISSIAQKTLGLEEPPVDSSVDSWLESKFAEIVLPFNG